jgi:hypothetical protein
MKEYRWVIAVGALWLAQLLFGADVVRAVAWEWVQPVLIVVAFWFLMDTRDRVKRIERATGDSQWPEPHGPLYDEWLKLKDAGDYYEWLARRNGWAEPYRSWANVDRSR